MQRSITVIVLAVAALLGSAGVGAQSPKTEKIDGYAEYFDGEAVISDGQRLVLTPTTRIKPRKDLRIASIRDIPLGMVIEGKGVRRSDGALAMTELEVKPNDMALFEGEVLKATEEMETRWLSAGRVFQPGENGRDREIGTLLTSGPAVTRVQGIMDRLLPPYVARDKVRPHVVDTKAWNAMAMGNGAVWVFTGLLNDMDDDEVAIVLGHELAHYTHEHSRKGFKRDFIAQVIAAGAMAVAEEIDGKKTKQVVGLATVFSLLAAQNGYGRDLEDQADRVGLRYAYQAGFDVTRGPRLWQRFAEKYGDESALTNFFFSDHSRARARVKNLEREIALNYAQRSGAAPLR